MTLPRTVPRLNCLLKSYVSRTVPRHNFSWRPTCQGPYQDILTHEVQCLTWPFEDIISCLTYVAMTVWRKLVSPMSQWPFEDIMSHQCCNDHMKLSCLTNVTMAVWRYHVSPMSPWPFEDVMTQTVWCVKDQSKFALAHKVHFVKGVLKYHV